MSVLISFMLLVRFSFEIDDWMISIGVRLAYEDVVCHLVPDDHFSLVITKCPVLPGMVRVDVGASFRHGFEFYFEACDHCFGSGYNWWN